MFFLPGVIAEDLLAALKILISKKYFTEASYNDAMSKLSFKNYDAPEKISIKASKLKGKAMSIMSHVRYFGLILKKIPGLDENIVNEDAFKLAISLSKHAEKLMAPAIRNYEVDLLEEDIMYYLDMRADMFQEFERFMGRPKPKHHFSAHYAEAIRKYGVCIAVWTARYESKNRIAKMIAISGKNFLNISKTVAVRQQFRQASVYFKGYFNTEKIILPQNIKMKNDLVGELSPLEHIIKAFMDETSILCGEISYNQQMYRTNDVIVLAVEHSDFISVGLIAAILYKEDSCYFVVNKYNALRDGNFGYFETIGFDEKLYFIRDEHLSDYKPLVMIGTAKRFKFALHHHLTVDITKETNVSNIFR